MAMEQLSIIPIHRDLFSTEGFQGNYLLWIQEGVRAVEIDGIVENDVSNALYFIDGRTPWRILHKAEPVLSGYVMKLPVSLMEHPTLKNLHISEVRLLAHQQVQKVTLAPGIAKRVQSILEMLDELAGSALNHKDEAIASLVKTLFVYTDGQCNIRSTLCENNAGKHLVFRFKKLIDQYGTEIHEVGDYAKMLHISAKHLNTCTREVLGVTAKHLIDEMRILRSRHLLKFSDLSIKEISFTLGFSSQDYFSYFLKKHTGKTPSMIRNG
ncbi:helix-turn-helix domain-containing protein [Robiginitalea sp. M366]|uniref:AraC family transcriptional regulator n=1 Tax=Robiginitalea aestuariiviva TaxID=3036903 RepID=UPI00240D1854|nr:AraC family transcriptional regulator [Robiginitalea aestuariiviva]MDG1570975.1 helix-turn-helix domain-containing protein [Robiginitalea aestuariiviva]